MRVDGAIRIGLAAIEAVWRGRSVPAGRRLIDRGTMADRSLESALGGILDAAPRRRFLSPHLRIVIADPHMQMAVIRFQQLPRSRSDLELLVTQRFCRDHRLEPSAATIAFAAQGEAQGGHHVLVCALNAALAKAVLQSFAARNVHPDIVAAESVFTIRALQSHLSGALSLLVLLYIDYATIVLWQAPDVIGHIGVFQQHDRPRPEFIGVLKTRIERYAALLSGERERPVVHILDCGDDASEAAAFHDLPYPVRDLRRDPAIAGILPSHQPAWTTIVEHGG
jgi:hypothetical protein